MEPTTDGMTTENRKLATSALARQVVLGRHVSFPLPRGGSSSQLGFEKGRERERERRTNTPTSKEHADRRCAAHTKESR